MPTRANVSSVDALESFRASLIVYMTKARPTVEEVSNILLRTRVWLENDARVYWENQVRKRGKILEDAKQELFSAEIANLRDASSAERLAVNRAKRAFDEAEAKLRTVKKWNRDFSSRVEPLGRELDKLHTVLSNEIPAAIAYLGEVVKTLNDYAGVAPSIVSSPAPAAESATTEAATAEPVDTEKSSDNKASEATKEETP